MRGGLVRQMGLASCALGVLLLGLVGTLLVLVHAQGGLTERVRRAGDSALAATELRSLVVDLQAGQRGYLLTSDPRFLSPYTAARDRWRSPEGRRLLAQLQGEREVVRGRIDSLIDEYLSVTIRRFPRDPAQVQIMVRSGLGKRRVDVLRGQLGTLIQAARSDRAAALDDLRRAERRAVTVAGAGMVAAAALIVLFTVYLTRAIVMPVRRVSIAAQRMSGGESEARVRDADRARGEIGDMARAFNQMAEDLGERTAALEARYAEVRAELERAATLQRRLLPAAAPVVPGLELAGTCVPAADVGGDYFDYIVDDRGRVTLLVADVAGHGIASALLMAMVRQVVRRHALAGAAPADVLRAANDELFEDLATVELFVTAFCVRLEPGTDVLEFANAGHNRPFLRRGTGAIEELDAEGVALGIIAGAPFESGEVGFAPGDALILYTDGVVEAEDHAGRALGDDALRRLSATLDGMPPRAGVARVVNAVRRHAGEVVPKDDVTVVIGRAGSPDVNERTS